MKQSQNISSILNSQFFQSSITFHNQLRQLSSWKLIKIRKFPMLKFITEGDEFFKLLWSTIENSKDYFWLTTYAIDSSPAADTTLIKLIEASKRGVHVVLFVDNVQSWAKQELIEKFKKSGGKYMILNPQWRISSIRKYFTKDVWRRHHEKLIVTDDKAIIGSSNIEGNYAGVRFGNSQFLDLNMYSENVILDQFRNHFIETADNYSFDLKTGQQNQRREDLVQHNRMLLQQFNKKYENSEFYPIGKYKLLHTDQQKNKNQIENDVLRRIKQSSFEIKIIQPYHYTMSKYQNEINKAIRKKNIDVQIITTGKRDQPVFKQMKNQMIFEKLLGKGTTIYQTRDRFLHSKVYMFDKRWVNLGSMNSDRWSWLINNECNILIDDPRVYQQINKYYETLKKSTRKVYRGYKISASQAASIGAWASFLYSSEQVMKYIKKGPPQQDYIVRN